MPEPGLPADQGVAGVGQGGPPRTDRRRHGVRTGDVTVDFAAVMARKDALIDHWVDGYAESLAHTDGLTLLYGEARFTGRSDAVFTRRRRRSFA